MIENRVKERWNLGRRFLSCLGISGMAILLGCSPEREVSSEVGLIDFGTLPVSFAKEYERRIAQGKDRGALAKLYHANGYVNEAAILYERLMDEESEDPLWPYLAHRIAQDFGETEKAVELLNAALALEKRNPLIYLRKGDLLLKIGGKEEAKASYDACLSIDPGNAYAYLGLGRLAVGEEDYSLAKKLLGKSVECDAKLASSYLLLASVFRELGASEEAETVARAGRSFSKFREVEDPWLDELLNHCFDPYRLRVVASMYVDTLRPERALPLLERSRSVAPGDSETLLELGKWYLKNGDKKIGFDLLEDSIGLEPDLEEAYYVAVSERQLEGQYERSLTLLEEALVRFPQVARFYRVAGISHQKLGQEEAAEAHFLKAVELLPSDTSSQIAAGNFFWQRNEKKKGAAFYEEARALSTVELDIRILLANYYFDEGRLADMKACIEEAYQITPDKSLIDELEANYQLRRGNELLRGGKIEAAENAYELCLAKRPLYRDAYANLMTLYMKTGQLEKARSKLGALVDTHPETTFAYPFYAAAKLKLKEVSGVAEILTKGRLLATRSNDRESLKMIVQLEQMLKSMKD